MKIVNLLMVLIVAGATHVQAQRMFEFTLPSPIDEKFVAQTNDPDVIAAVEAQLALDPAERNMFINGKIDYGNGGHNLDWKWHFVPNEWSLAEITIELCDGRPSYIDNDLQYWIETVGRFCPWTATVSRDVSTTGIGEPGDAGLSIVNLAPNPAATETRIQFSVRQPASVEISVLNAVGQSVLELAPHMVESGTHHETLALHDLAQGVYFCRIRIGAHAETRLLVLAR